MKINEYPLEDNVFIVLNL